jgi:cathepsin C
LTRIFKVQNSKYVGGAYGKSSELALMDELYKNGPIVVSFEPDEGFNVY